MGENTNKSYNNPGSWENLESSNNLKKTIIEMDSSFENQLSPDFVEAENYETEEIPVMNQDDVDEVLQLTQYGDGSLTSTNNYGVIAEYKEIDIEQVSKKHQKDAKNFVDRITKFILDFKDVETSKEYEDLVKTAGVFQLQNLADLLYLVDVNKQMLNNIIRRVNASQAEDYAVIASYTQLQNQHLKLMKELCNTYRNIPTVIKKIRADVMCNQELLPGDNTDEVITENFGETQVNTGKQLHKMLELRRLKKLEEDNQ